MNNPMVVVTGAGGWLGSELTEQLLKKGERVKAINYTYTEQLKKLKALYPEKLEVVIGDICDNSVISDNIKDGDVVYHLAAKVHFIPTNQKEEEEFFNINTKATEEIFKTCIQNHIKRVIFFSTVSVYKQTDELITTDSPKEPTTVYGKSKLQAEEIANCMYQQYGLPVTIIEPVTVYGEGDVGNFKKLENMIQKGICVKFGSGENKKTVIYYKDLIQMAINIAEDATKIGQTIICGTEVLTINEINQILIEKVGKRVLKITVPAWIARMIIKCCSISILKKIRRKVMALMQNNEIKIDIMLKEYTKFKQYELRGIKKQ